MSLDRKKESFKDKRVAVARLKSWLRLRSRLRSRLRLRLRSLLWIGIVASSLLSVGCAPRLSETLNRSSIKSPVSPELMIRVDVAASEIRWNTAVPVSADMPLRLRSDIARHLQEAFNAGQSFDASSGYHPARFLLEVHNVTESNMMVLIPCFFYLTFVGCPHSSMSANITLSVEYRGKIFSVSAAGQAYFNFYNQMVYPYFPQLSPVAAALGDAAKQLAPQLRASTRADRASSSSAVMVSDSRAWAATPTSRWPRVRSERAHASRERPVEEER